MWIFNPSFSISFSLTHTHTSSFSCPAHSSSLARRLSPAMLVPDPVKVGQAYACEGLDFSMSSLPRESLGRSFFLTTVGKSDRYKVGSVTRLHFLERWGEGRQEARAFNVREAGNGVRLYVHSIEWRMPPRRSDLKRALVTCNGQWRRHGYTKWQDWKGRERREDGWLSGIFPVPVASLTGFCTSDTHEHSISFSWGYHYQRLCS